MAESTTKQKMQNLYDDLAVEREEILYRINSENVDKTAIYENDNSNQFLYDRIENIDHILKELKCAINSNCQSVMEESNYYFLKLQELDRQRIARDLHDTVIQNLVHMIHKMEITSKYIDEDSILAKLELSSATKYLRETIDEIRNSIYNLRPMSFDDLGFQVTLERFFDNFRVMSGMQVVFNSDFSFDDLDSVFLLTLLKIVQECCNNSMKHSGADRINVTMNKKGNEMHICISDNGRGCSEDCLEKGYHFGLDIIRERVSMLSGRCRFECNEGNGFIVTIILPMIRTEGDIMNERENTNCG